MNLQTSGVCCWVASRQDQGGGNNLGRAGTKNLAQILGREQAFVINLGSRACNSFINEIGTILYPFIQNFFFVILVKNEEGKCEVAVVEDTTKSKDREFFDAHQVLVVQVSMHALCGTTTYIHGPYLRATQITRKRCHSCVVVDRLTKYSHFLLLTHPDNAQTVVHFFFGKCF